MNQSAPLTVSGSRGSVDLFLNFHLRPSTLASRFESFDPFQSHVFVSGISLVSYVSQTFASEIYLILQMSSTGVCVISCGHQLPRSLTNRASHQCHERY